MLGKIAVVERLWGSELCGMAGVDKNLVVFQFLFDLERFVCMSNIIYMAEIIC